MKLAIVMPVVLQTDILLTMTREAASFLKTRHEPTLYILCNRLHICTPEFLRANLQSQSQVHVVVVHEPGVERSVAGAWNEGCKLALADGADYIPIVANDTRLRDNCLDELIEFGQKSETDLWSGISFNCRNDINPYQVTDGADFSCVMMRPSTLEKHGFFDHNYRPAYFEDNDYYGRVILGAGTCKVVHRAQFFHHGSMTIREDPEMAHHVSYWFEKNRAYFFRKWGVVCPENSPEGILQHYYRHPFNDVNKPLTWFPTDDNLEYVFNPVPVSQQEK
jgi:GT2 family glycosyltransferase